MAGRKWPWGHKEKHRKAALKGLRKNPSSHARRRHKSRR